MPLTANFTTPLLGAFTQGIVPGSGGGASSPPADPPGFSPLDVAGTLGWYDAQDFSTFTLGAGDEVTALGNKVPAGAGLVAVAEGGPTYVSSHASAGGLPALEWPSADNSKGLWLGADASVHDVYVVLQYKDGLDTTFDNHNTITSDVAGLTTTSSNRIMGRWGQSNVYTNVLPSGVTLHINGGGGTVTLLPMPLCVLHIKRPTTWLLTAIGSRNGGGARAWQGIMCEVLAYNQVVSAEDDTLIVDYLMNKWSIT